MNNIKKAIQLAIEKGEYLGKGAKFNDFDIQWDTRVLYYTPTGYATHKDICAIFIDPLFWQSLGKALGWGKPEIEYGYIAPNGHTSWKGEKEFNQPVWFTRRWQNEWHCFIDHLTDGKDPDKFFEQLLSK